MAIQIFLGEPPAHIKQWIIDHQPMKEEPDPVDTSDWGKLVAALEDCKPSDFNGLNYVGENELLTELAVGAGATVKYKIDDINPVNTTWINLGYNASIPEYVKYRRAIGTGWKHVWIPSRKSELLAPIAVGDQVYAREFDTVARAHTWTAVEGEVVTAIDGTFTYGNNCTYDVPTSITTDKGTYTLCGYNITLNSHALLMLDAAEIGKICFDRQNNDSANRRNIYDISRIRHWMNDLTCTDAACYDGSAYIPVTFQTLINKISNEEGLIRNIAPTVNRTWVHANHVAKATQALDTNHCEHLADKFWLLGYANVNKINEESYPDCIYDTTKFLQLADNASRKKFKMLSNGSVGGSTDYWHLRSASSDYDSSNGNVLKDGSVGYNGSVSGYGCSPAFQIG